MKRSLFDRFKKDLQSDGWTPKHLIATLVFGAIVLVFVFFGMSGRHDAIGSGSAAQVNATIISAADLQQESARLERMYAPMFRGQMTGDMQRQFVQQQALENLVSSELMSQGAGHMGIMATDEEVRQVILKEIPAFQDAGRFQRDRYVGILQANHWTPAEFEDRIRKERRTQRLRRLFEVVSAPTVQELEKEKDLKEQKRDVAFVRFEKTQVVEKMTVPAGEISNRLAQADFAKRVQGDFELNKARYSVEEQVKAQHILIKADPADEKSMTAAREKIAKISERAKREDFGKLAAELSDDTGSKANKGDLGFFGRGKMVPEFEKAAFSQSAGVVGAPVQTPYGIHLIKVLEHKAASEAKFEPVKNDIARKLIATQQYDEVLKTLEADLDQKNTAGVEGFLKKLGLKWEETGYFDLSADVVPKLGSSVASASALEVSEKNPISKKLVRDAGGLFILKWVGDKREASADGTKMADSMAREKSYDMMGTWLESVKKDAKIERNTRMIKGIE